MSNTGQRSGKADPDCERCGGRGVEVSRHRDMGLTSQGPMAFTAYKRCTCTDLPISCGTITVERKSE